MMPAPEQVDRLIGELETLNKSLPDIRKALADLRGELRDQREAQKDVKSLNKHLYVLNQILLQTSRKAGASGTFQHLLTAIVDMARRGR